MFTSPKFLGLYRICAVLVFSITCVATRAQSELPDYSEMVVFGNSLSDNGNAHEMLCGVRDCSPDLFTNGRNAVEMLAEILAHPETAFSVDPVKNYLVTDTLGYSFNVFRPEGTNYAIGGTVVPVERQVGRYLASVSNSANEDGLYVFFLGVNWVNYSIQEEIEGEACSADDPYYCPGRKAGIDRLKAFAQSLHDSVDTLVAAGARHFLVINTDSFSMTPNGKQYFSEYLAELDAYTFEYNHFLYQHVNSLNSRHDINIQYFDLYTLVDEIKSQPEEYSFSNIEDACGIYNTSTQSFTFEAPCSEDKVSEYFYYDGVHWSENMHNWLASAIFLEAVEMAPLRPELVSQNLAQVENEVHLSIETSEDAVAAAVQFPYSNYPMENTYGQEWELLLNDFPPGKYPYSIVLENAAGFKSRSYGDVFYVCEEKTVDQFVASGQVQFKPGSRWFWFSTPGEYVVTSTGQRVADEDQGGQLLSMAPANGAWELCQ